MVDCLWVICVHMMMMMLLVTNNGRTCLSTCVTTCTQSLLDCDRPLSVIHYDTLGRGAGVVLNRRCHNYVLQAYAAVADPAGLFAHMREWTQVARPLGVTSPSIFDGHLESPARRSTEVVGRDVRLKPLQHCPDGRTYAIIIDFFIRNKQMMTVSYLEELFESLRDDHVEPSEMHIGALFSFASSLRAAHVSSKMLTWYFQGLQETTPTDAIKR